MELCARIRNGDGAAAIELLHRDHPVADLLFRAAMSNEVEVELLAYIWKSLIRDIKLGAVTDSLRPTMLERVITVLDDRSELDMSETRSPPKQGPFLPDDDRWAGWWADDPTPWPESSRPTPDQILHVLRRLPLAQRVLLVIRDVAGLRAEVALQILGYTSEEQRIVLGSARDSYVAYVDQEMCEA